MHTEKDHDFKINTGEIESSSNNTEMPWHAVLQILNTRYNKSLTTYNQKGKKDMIPQLSASKHEKVREEKEKS